MYNINIVLQHPVVNKNESDSATILVRVTMPEDGRVRPKHIVKE
jgi:hypothetical protein